MSDFGKGGEDLRPFVNFLNGSSGSMRIVYRDVLEDIFAPSPRFIGPRYCGHDRMRCAISSFEIVRFASESASPRPTMT